MINFTHALFKGAHEQKRDGNISKLWPADSFSLNMRPAQELEFDIPGPQKKKKYNTNSGIR
jgi:hypothetical protein